MLSARVRRVLAIGEIAQRAQSSQGVDTMYLQGFLAYRRRGLAVRVELVRYLYGGRDDAQGDRLVPVYVAGLP